MFCRDLRSGSHFIVQTSNFLLINTTAVTLGQGHGKVIQYISPDPYIFFVPNIKGLAQTVLTWEGKVFADTDVDADDGVETNWKHKVTPDRGDLNMSYCGRIRFNGFKRADIEGVR